MAREFVSLKYMTISSYVLIYVMNATFYLLSSLILTLLYLYLRLSFVNIFFLLHLGYLQLEIKGIHSLLFTDLYGNSFVPFSSFYPSLLQNGLVRFVAVLIAKYIPFVVDPP